DLASDPVCLDWLGDVFDLLRTEIDELDRKFCPDLVAHRARDTNSAWLCKNLQPGCDVNGIAEQIVALHHDVADMDADTEPHLLTGRSIRIRLRYGVLHRDS